MKILKRTIAFLLAALMIMSLVPLSFAAEEATSAFAAEIKKAGVIATGYSGKIKWTVDKNYVLYLEGSGEFKHSSSGGFYDDNDGGEHFSTPCISTWEKYNEKIKKVKLNISNCKSLDSLFRGATTYFRPDGTVETIGKDYTVLEEIDFCNSDLSKVETMDSAFCGCPAKRINIANMDVRQLYTTSFAFVGCHNLETLDLTGWNTQNLNDMTFMFWGCSSLKKVKAIEKLNVSRVKSFNHTFSSCDSLKTIDLSKWDVSSVMYMDNMFSFCPSLKTVNTTGWNTENLISTEAMFAYCKKLENAGFEKLNTSKLTNINRMFHNCEKLSGSIRFTSKISRYKDAFNWACINSGSSFTIYYAEDCTKSLAGKIADTRSYSEDNIKIKAECNGKHRMKDVDAVAATLKNDGNTAGRCCNICGYAEKAAETIPMIKDVALSYTKGSYTGKEKRPVVTVKDAEGKVLTAGKDYTVTYSDNVKVGTATAKVTFKGKYSGTKKLEYQIVPGKVTDIKTKKSGSSVKISWSPVAGARTYRIYKYDKATKKYIQTGTTTDTEYTMKNIKSGTSYTYYIKASKTVNDVKYLSFAYSEINIGK